MYMDDEGPSSSSRGWSGGGPINNNFYSRNYNLNEYDQDARFTHANRGRGRYNGRGRYQNSYNGGFNNNYNNYNSNQYAERPSFSRGGNSRGRGRQGNRGRGRAIFQDPDDIQFVKILKGHTATVTALAVDHSSGELYSGSADGTIRIWNYQTGECLRTVEIGGKIDSILLEGCILVVSFHDESNVPNINNNDMPSAFKVFNLETGTEDFLQGHVGPVYCMTAAENLLFTGAHDANIRVWQFDINSGTFKPMAELTAANNGHTNGVSSLSYTGKTLFSGDLQGYLKEYMITSSSDGTVKVWQADVNGAQVLNEQCVHCQPPPPEAAKNPAIWNVHGIVDNEGRSLLLICYDNSNKVWIRELPDFIDRGHLNAINGRCLASAQGHIFAGDRVTGAVKVWKWR